MNPPSALHARHFRHGGNIYAAAHVLGVNPEQLIDFSASINPLGPPRQARLAYKRALSRIVHYPEPYAETLTGALARYHNLAPQGILVGNGSTQLIYILAQTLQARRVLLVAPLFSEYEAGFSLNRARITPCILRPPDFALSLEKLHKALVKGADLLVLTNPNSPTGVLLPGEQIKEIARMCRRTRTTVIVDETFIDWREDESCKHLAIRSPHLIVLRSLTKFFALPGLRVGYMIAHPRVVEQLRARLEPWAVNTVAQEVALACLQDRDFVRRSRAFLERERAWLAARLSAFTEFRVFPSQANFLLVQLLPEKMPASVLAQALAQKRLLIRPCENFPGLGSHFFRVAVRQRTENKRLLTALKSAFP